MPDTANSAFEASPVPLHDLEIAPENPRSGEIDPERVDELARNISANGILTPLIGYIADSGKVAIVAGGRRVRALNLLLEEKKITSSSPVPVRIVEKALAFDAGVAEQLSHEPLTDIEVLRLLKNEDVAGRTITSIAYLVGRSERWVRKHYKILDLDETIVDAVLDGRVSIQNAIALTYLENQELADAVQLVLDGRNLDIRSARRSGPKRPWEDFVTHGLVSLGDYITAGGGVEEDLFSPGALIDNPELLDDLIEAAVFKKVREDYPDAAFYLRKDARPTNAYYGMDTRTPEEIKEYKDLDQKSWDEGGLTDEEQDRLDELDKKMSVIPEAVRAHLGVAWYTRSFSREGEKPYYAIEDVLPEDEESLKFFYENGYLSSPDKPEPLDDSDEPKEDRLSGALMSRIQQVRGHVLRQELASKVNETLGLYSAYLAQTAGYGYFSTHHLDANFPDELASTALEPSPAMEKIGKLGDSKPSEILEMKPADQRSALAWQVLQRITPHHPATQVLDAAAIRRWFTPNPEWMNQYTRAQLVKMLPEGGYQELVDQQATKKADLIDAVLKVPEKEKDWLPLGF